MYAPFRLACLLYIALSAAPLFAEEQKSPPPAAAELPGHADSEVAVDTVPAATSAEGVLPQAAELPAETGESPVEALPDDADSEVAVDTVPAATSAEGVLPQADELPAEMGESLFEAPTGDALDQIESAVKASEVTSAKAELTAYIEQIEDATHRYSPELVRPLVILGDIQMGEKDYAAASETFGRAVHIDRVAHGLHAPTQSAIIYKEADALVALGDIAAANDREMYAFEVQERRHDPGSMDLLPATFRLAEWYLKTSNVLAARGMFGYATNILETNDALQGPAAIQALRGVAYTYRQERFPPIFSSPEPIDGDGDLYASPALTNPMGQQQDIVVVRIGNFSEGERALQRVANIMLKDPAASAKDKADAVIDLADWYLLFDHRDRAEPLYVEANRLLAEAKLETERARLADPEMLYFPAPPPLPSPPVDKRENLTQGHVTVGYTVTDTGEVHDLTTLDTEPDDLMEFRVRRSMRIARFRPALVDGTLVTSRDQSYRYEYQFYPKKPDAQPLEEPPESPAAATPRESEDAQKQPDAAASAGVDVQPASAVAGALE